MPLKEPPNPFEVFIALAMIWAWWGYMIFFMNWYNSQPTENIQLLLAFTMIGIRGTQVTTHMDIIFKFVTPRIEKFWEKRRLDREEN